jgi:Carboxypeptidase regulatory-like domain
VTFLVLLGLWFAQQTRDIPRHSVTGTVVNAATGEPIPRALVQFAGRSSLTGPDGRFEFREVPEGQFNVNVTKPGFFDMRNAPGFRRPQLFRVTSGDNDFRLTLVPAARITGRVLDQDGEPVEQVSIEAVSEQIVNGRKQWGQRGGGFTDDDGGYRLDDVVPGRYVLFQAGRALEGSDANGAPQLIAPGYYPDAPDLVSAQVIDLQPGQEFRADFHVAGQRGYRVTGRIIGYSAGPGFGWVLTNSTGQIINWPTRLDQKAGGFVTQLPNGVWELTMTSNRGEGQTYEARQEIAVNNADINNLQIFLHRAVSIPISVTHAAPVAEGTLNLNVHLTEIDRIQPRQYWPVNHGQPPSWSFDNVGEGKYRVDIVAPGNECVESAWYGNLDLLRNYLLVAGDAAPQPITISMRSDCGTLRARVEGEASSGALVVVHQDSMGEPTTVLFEGVEANAVISPGTYRVYAFSDLDGVEYANPEAMRDYPSQTVEIAPNQKLEISVKLIDSKETK